MMPVGDEEVGLDRCDHDRAVEGIRAMMYCCTVGMFQGPDKWNGTGRINFL